MPPKHVSALTQALQQSRHEYPNITNRRLSVYPTDSTANTEPHPAAELLSEAHRQLEAKARSDRSTRKYGQHPEHSSADTPPRSAPGETTIRPTPPRATEPTQPLTFLRRSPPFDKEKEPERYDSDEETAVDSGSGSETECEDGSDGSGSSGETVEYAPRLHDHRPSPPGPFSEAEGSPDRIVLGWSGRERERGREGERERGRERGREREREREAAEARWATRVNSQGARVRARARARGRDVEDEERRRG